MELVRRLRAWPRRGPRAAVAGAGIVGIVGVTAAIAMATVGGTPSSGGHQSDEPRAAESSELAFSEPTRTPMSVSATTVPSTVPATPAASTPVAGEGGGDGESGDGGSECHITGSAGACPPLAIPPPPVDETAGGIPDYPGRYQVDPATGQMVDTGIASMPGPAITPPVVTTTVPPPVFLPEQPPSPPSTPVPVPPAP